MVALKKSPGIPRSPLLALSSLPLSSSYLDVHTHLASLAIAALLDCTARARMLIGRLRRRLLARFAMLDRRGKSAEQDPDDEPMDLVEFIRKVDKNDVFPNSGYVSVKVASFSVTRGLYNYRTSSCILEGLLPGLLT